MTTADLPDWSAPIDAGGAPAWLMHGQPGRAAALPAALTPRHDDGRPGYALQAFRITGGADIDMFGVITIRFVGEYALETRQAGLPAIRLEPLALAEGYASFAATSAIDIGELATPQRLVSAGTGLKLTQRLTGAGIRAFQQIAETSASPIRARMIVAIPGIALRAPARARIDGDRLAALLAIQPGWSREALVDALKTGSFGPAVQLVLPGDPQGDGAAVAALADRLTASALDLAIPAPADNSPLWRPRDGALAGHRLAFDLDDETIVRRAFLIESPPLLAPDIETSEIAGDGAATGIATGFHLLTIDANLPPRRVGTAAIGIDLTIPAAPPQRSQTISHSLRFDAATPMASFPIRLGATEKPGFDYRTFVIALVGGATERLSGELLHNDDDHLTIPPGAFAVDFVRAEATPALLALGKVAIAWGGTRSGDNWRSDAELTTAAPSVAVARPRDLETRVIRVQLIAADGSRTLEIPASPDGDLWLDIASLAESGPQKIGLEILFDAGPAPVALEYAGEDSIDAITMVRIRPDAPRPDIHWLPISPLRTGVRLRWVLADGSRGDWSPVIAANTVQILNASAATGSGWPGGDTPPEPGIDTSGLTLIATDPGAYVFRATAPRLATGPDGRPAAQLTVASSSGFLQLTAEFAVSPDRLAALATALERRDGTPPRLSPAFDTVDRTELLLAGTAIATGSASGLPPQTSLLSAMLDAAQMASVQRALGGERGIASIRYTIAASDPVTTDAGFAADSHSTASTTALAARTSSRTMNRHSITAEADLADLIEP